MTSPVGKKRKQPGPSGGSSGDEQHRGYGGGLTPAENDENSREANRQAKKMKRVVTISGWFFLMCKIFYNLIFFYLFLNQ